MKGFLSLLSAFLIITIFSACSHSSSNNVKDFIESDFKESYNLGKGEAYKNDSLFLSSPRWIRYHPDSLLIIQEMGTPYLVKVVDLKSGSVQQIIPKGKGTNEMIVAWGIDLSEGHLSVFDGAQKKICQLTLDDHRKFKFSKEILLQDKGTIGAYPVSKDLIVGLSGITQNSRLSLFDEAGAIVDTMGNFPSLGNNNEFKSDNNLFSSYITGTPEGDKIALACTNSDIIEIYNTKKGLIKRFQGPEGIQLSARQQDVGVGTIMVTEPGFRGYSNAVANKQEFWVGYVGYKMQKGLRPKRADMYPKKIFCFDWNGNPLKKIEVGVPLISFAVDWQHGKIYGLTESKSPEIVVFDLHSKMHPTI